MTGDRFSRTTSRVSRRRVLTIAASVGVGGAAVSVAGLSAARETGGAANPGETIVVHLRDAKSGTLDVFAGSRRIEVRDADLAARLIEASRRG
jgi:hypothetical protein